MFRPLDGFKLDQWQSRSRRYVRVWACWQEGCCSAVRMHRQRKSDANTCLLVCVCMCSASIVAQVTSSP